MSPFKLNIKAPVEPALVSALVAKIRNLECSVVIEHAGGVVITYATGKSERYLCTKDLVGALP